MKGVLPILVVMVFAHTAFAWAENANETATKKADAKKASEIKGDVHLSGLPVPGDLTFIGPTPPPCPLVADPVCGNNGVSYLNPCFAQLAGVTQFTSGVCFSSCINPQAINLNTMCPQVFNPVCGCNGVTYANPCEAQKRGITSFTPGPCNASCFNPALIVTSGSVSINPNTGVLTMVCAQTNAPVCGCNGVTYANACVAQANGVNFYTAGSCQGSCINPSQMNPNAVCPTVYNPVCGCNGVTYPNACTATAAGVTSVTQGACGTISAWCNKAVPIQCGDYRPYETTVGAGNHITTYPGCNNNTFAGPEKVYILHKTTPGDLQIGLEIMTPGLDLDLFLLSGNCNQITCLRSSTTNNSITNNEGILLANAPIGIYYIVVDGQFANAQGQYRLEVSCGYLNCNNAIPLNCGVPFNHTNLNGNDDVSLYGCDGNIFNVENNGPEVVHTFTVTQAGWVNITLSNLQDNLELFLLRSCDRGSCAEFSETGGTANEQITAYLQPGTYYVVVDGYNGAVSNYTLLIECASNCNLQIASATPAAAGCGQSNGSIALSLSGGTAPYSIQYTGPVSATVSANTATRTLNNLPAGLYVVRITDNNGCTVQQNVIVPSNSAMSVSTMLQADICGAGGSAQLTIMQGTPPYQIQLTGPVSGNYNAGNTNPYTITGLAHGSYVAYVRDAQGCVVVRAFTISYSSGNFSFVATPTAATCTGPGSIQIGTTGGQAPYTVTVTGPVSATLTANSNQFSIPGLPGGTYTIVIRSSGNQCTFARTVVVPNTGLRMTASARHGACNQPGSILLQFTGGTPPFQISWGGPTPGTATTSQTSYIISNLNSGTYPVQVTDATGCVTYEILTLNNTSNNLSATFTPISGGCTATGSIAVNIANGTPPFVITWTGPQSGTFTTSLPGHTIANLPAGNYMVQVTAAGNCTRSGMVTLNAGGGLVVNATAQSAGCSQAGSIALSISGASGPYQISWTGPTNGSATANTANYTIPNVQAGTYSIVVTAANGCQATRSVTVSGSGGGLQFSLMPLAASCQLCAAIWIDIYNGTGPFVVSWTGPTTGSVTTTQTNFDVYCVNSGTYTVTITDANGCSGTQTVVIPPSTTALQVTATPTHANCVGSGGSPTGSVLFNIANGQAPFLVQWVGPVTSSWTTTLQAFSIYNLPPGSYNFTFTDANLCVTTISVQIGSSLGVVATPVPAPCGQLGSIQLSIPGGTAPYTIVWTGASSGSATANTGSFTITNRPAGSYTITVTSANGCSQTVQVTLAASSGNIQCTAVAVPGQCGSNGSIHVGMSSGTPNFTVSWTGPTSGTATTANFFYQINNLPSGVYTVTVTDANGCTCTHTVHLQNGTGNISLNITPVPGNCNQNGSLWVDILGGTGPWTLQWTGPANGSVTVHQNGYNIPNLPSGTYTVKVTDANGCMFSRVVTLNNNAGGNPVVSLTPQNGQCGQPGRIVVNISGATGPYTVAWAGPVSGSATTPSNTYTIQNLPSGNYTVTVTAANGCSGSATTHITNSGSGIHITGQAEPGTCGQNGAIWMDIIGGSPPFTINWTGPVNGSITFNNFGYLITNLPNGTYTVRVTDFYGCQSNALVITVNSGAGPSFTATPHPGICGQNGSIALAISGSPGPYMVTWAGPANGSVNGVGANYTIQNLPSGTYTITVKDAQNCTATRTVVLTGSNNLQVTAVPVPGTCGQHGQIHLGFTGGTAPYQIHWTGPVSGNASTSNAFFNITNLPSGTYTITVTDAQGCTRTQTVTLNNGANNLNLVITPVPGTCGQNGSLWVDIIGGAAPWVLSWSGPVSGSITLHVNGYNIPNLPSGTYTVTVTSQGCTFSRTVTLTNGGNNLQVTAVPVPGTCGQHGQIHLGFTGGTAPYQIHWTGPVSGNASTSNAFFNITNLPSGTYTITVTDAQGCTRTQTVTLNNGANNLNLVITPVPGTCGQNGSLWVDIIGGAAPWVLSWSGPVSGSITLHVNGYNIPNLPSGTYTVTVTSQGCTFSRTVTLTNGGNNLQVTAVPVPGTCGQHGQIHLGFTGGTAPYQIHWTGPVSGNASTSNAFFNITNLPSGTYTITVTDAQGCTRTQTVTLNNGANNLNLVITPVPGTCGQNGSLWVDIIGGAAPWVLSWSGPVSGSITLHVNGYNIPNLPSGTYTVTVTSQGCTFSRTVTLTNGGNNLQVTAVPVPGTCGQHGQIHLGFTGGTAPYQIHWTGPVSGNASTSNAFFNITNLPSGTYTITVTDAQGCTRTQTVTLNNGANNLNLVITPVPGTCGQHGQIHLGFTGGTAPYQIHWTGPVSGNASTSNAFFNITNLPSGTYTITVTDAQGCTRTQTVTLTNGANNLQVTAVPVPGTCGQHGQIHLGFTGGTAPYQIHWTGPVSGNASTSNAFFNITNLPSGTYTITVTDAQGCTRTQTVTLNNGANNLNLVITPVPGTCGQNGSLWVDIIGGAAPWVLSWSGPVSGSITLHVNGYSIPNLPSGTYTVTVTSHGCTFSRTVTLNNGGNNLQVTAVPVPGTCGQHGQIHLGFTGGTAPYQIHWTGPVSGNASTSNAFFNITNLPSGTYTITVTDAQGCTRTQTVTLNNGANNLQITAVGIPGVCGQNGQIHVGMTGGTAPFTVSWAGPASGSASTSNAFFNITNLPSGSYTVTVTDAQGCTRSQSLLLNNGANNLQITVVPVPGLCAQLGQIHVGMTGGTAPFTVSWTGPASGSASTSNFFYNITNLPGGTYTVTVTDAQGCTRTQTVTLNNGANNLQITAVPVPGACGQTGQIHVGITGGTAPFTVSWTGPASGSASTSNAFYNIVNLPSGTYTVTVTDAQGCTRSATATLTNSAGITLTATGVSGVCGQNGSVQLTISGAAAPYSVSWAGPVSGSATAAGGSFTIPNLPSGTYTITAGSGQNCTATQSVTLNNGQAFNMTAVATPGICGQNGSITLTFTGGVPPIAINWTGPVNGSANTSASSYTISNLPSGTYTITATTSQNCVSTRTVTLTNSTSTLAVIATPVNGLCGNPGQVQLTISGGTAPYTIAWTGAASGTATTSNTSFTVPNLGQGAYTFTVTDASNCANSTSASVNVAETDLEITTTANTGNCGQEGSVQVIISGGNAGYTIAWSGPESGSATTSNNSFIINSLTPGTYQISVTDATGCVETQTSTLSSPEANMEITLTRVNGVCAQPGSITVSIVSGNAPYTLTWAGPVNGSTTTSASNFIIADAPAGTYFVTGTDSRGCIDTDTIVVTTTGSVSVAAVPSNGVCGMPGSITVNLVGGTSPYTITWSGAASGSTSITGTTHTINNLASGTYNISVTSANGCTAATTATLNNTGTVFTINAFPFHGLCGAQGYLRVQMFGGGGPFMITWTGPASGTATTSAATYDITNLPNGIYMIQVVNAQGCTAMDVEMINNSNTGGLVADVSAINGVCGVPGAIWITILQGQGPFVITWTGPQSGSITTSSTDFDIPNLPQGTYTVTIRDFNLCEATYTVTLINAPDNLNVTLTANNNTCGNPGSITVQIAGNAPPYVITWTSIYGSGNQTITGNTFTIPNLQTGNYTVRVDDAAGCHEINTRQVYNEAGFTMNIVPNVGGCGFQGSLQINVSGGTAPFNVTWTGPVSGSATFSTQSYNIFGLPPGAYNVHVTDATGCTRYQLVNFNAGYSAPVSSFTFSVNVLTVSFTNHSSPGSYLWQFGDGATSTAVNPVHTYAQDGLYNVCLIVSNPCGTTTYCFKINIQVPSNYVILDVGETSGLAGQNILVPVRIRNCSNLASLAGSLSVQNPSVANIVSILPAAIAPQFNPVNKTFNFFSNTGQGVPLQQNQILFYLVVQLTGSPGQSTPIRIVESPLPIEVTCIVNGQAIERPYVTFPGSATIISPAQVSGEILTYWGAPVAEAEVHIGNDHMDMMEMTDENGHYEAPDIPAGETMTIRPSKYGNPANGLSTYALFIGQRFILGMNPSQIESPYQIIAGDANCNGAFTTLDLFLIQQLIIGVRDSFAHCPSWVFVSDDYVMPQPFDAYNVFPYPNCDSMMIMGDTLANFTGVKVGDLLGHANPNNLQDGSLEPRSAPELELVTADKSVSQGQVISIPVRSSNFHDITNYQLGLWFNPQYFAFEGFDPAAALPFATVAAGTTQVSQGRISISWFNMAGTGANASPDDVLFTIRLRALQPASSLEGLMEVRSQWIQSEAYNAAEERMGVILRFEPQGTTDVDVLNADGYFLHQNAPNPFFGQTAISFDLPQAMDADLVITDQLGRVVRLVRGNYPAGRNTVWFDAESLAQGAYRYTLKTAGYTATRTMIVVK